MTSNTLKARKDTMTKDSKSNAPQIRDARPDESARIALLLRAAYAEYRKSMPPGAWQVYLADIVDVRGRMSQGNMPVAEMDGKLVGTVTLYMDGRSSYQEGWPEGWAAVRLLGVDPKYRGRGIGRALMDECIRRCRQRGVKTVGLHTAEIMAVAKGMYEHIGFTRAPKHDFHPMQDVTIMAYKLDL